MRSDAVGFTVGATSLEFLSEVLILIVPSAVLRPSENSGAGTPLVLLPGGVLIPQVMHVIADGRSV
jgi:hypothetical protein